MSYSLKEAAESVGRGKSAILRAIQRGTISAKRNVRNEWEIDPAELHRVYAPITRNDAGNTNTERHATGVEHMETPDATGVIQRENVLLREQIDILKEERIDLRRRLDEDAIERRKAAEEIRRLTLLITHQVQTNMTTAEVKTTTNELWKKIFGKKK